ncbi:MAG: CusA/CzcA family heavy metal efflux RND transporter [Sphingomonas sp.]|nr:CusA/CzcA family heavy metal efflux RND transporter [Sphingomonas sp.]
MIDRLLDMAVRLRWAVLAITLLLAAYGAYQLVRVPIDAVPDITNKQVQVNTSAPAFGPLDIERLITFPTETALAGIPGLTQTRSISRNGFSQVTAIFRDDVDLYFARQQVAERLNQGRETLPAGVEPQMGPVSTGLGEVLMWSVDYAPAGTKQNPRIAGRPGFQPDGSFLTPEGERLSDDIAKLAYLRTIEDWVIRPQLRTVEGVAGVDSIGGYQKQFVVEPDPARLAAYNISFADLATALENANVSVGGNFVERAGEAFLVKADSRIRRIDEIARAAVTLRGGNPVTVADIASVRVGGELRTGGASIGGHETVIGTVLMLAGGNSRIVAKDAAERLRGASRSLPPGVKVTIVYDRSTLVDATISTVQKNLAEGALLVTAMLFWLLGNIRAAIIAALVIPLSFLMMATGMNQFGISGNLMSLGALDFGLIVDGSIIIIENCLGRLSLRQHAVGRTLKLPERLHEVLEASREMVRPTIFGQAIILLVFVPLLTFTGVEGKMFTPMATTLMLALIGAFALSLTFVPAMVAILIQGRVAEKEVRAIEWTKKHYEPLLGKVIAKPWPLIGAGIGTFVVALLIFLTLGREFIPTLNEGDIGGQIVSVPSTSLPEKMRMEMQAERLISQMPEVAFAYSKTGTTEVGSDPQGLNNSDIFIIMKPRSQWPDGSVTKDQIIRKVEDRVEVLIGNAYDFSQPIQNRFEELLAGVRGAVAVKVFGSDLGQLNRIAQQISGVITAVPGSADVRVEQIAGSPTLDVQLDRNAIATYGLSVADVSDTIGAALGGREAGLVFEGERRFPIAVRMPSATRNDLDSIGALPVMLPEFGAGPRLSVPLRQLAHFQISTGLNQVSRENGQRRVVVQANVRGRDLGSFVTESQANVERRVKLPPGVTITWGGQYENLQAASARLSIVIPIVLALIFGILFLALRGVTPALAVYSAVPLGLAGGIFGLAIARLPFSISAAVGLIVLSGVTVLNGLVVMTSIEQRISAGVAVDQAIQEGMMDRVRAVLITGIVPAVGFIPMAIATGRGAEVQKPLAVVVIAGLVVSTLLTLFVLPALSQLLIRAQAKRHMPGDYDLEMAADIASSAP